MKKIKSALQFEVEPANKEKTIEAFFQYFKLSSLLFDRKKDEIYDVTDIPKTNMFYQIAMDMAKQLGIEWDNMTHEDSNRIMLSMLEDSFNLIRDIEDSKSVILKTQVIVSK